MISINLFLLRCNVTNKKTKKTEELSYFRGFFDIKSIKMESIGPGDNGVNPDFAGVH